MQGTAKDGSGIVIYAEVSVVEESDAVLVKSVIFSSLDGEGTAGSPYIAEVANSQTARYVFTVMPRDATNKTINWQVVKKVGDSFVPYTQGESAPVEITETKTTSITVKGLASGEGYIKGTAADGSGITAIIRVGITAFTPVTAITSDVLMESESGETDYEFTTALGTKWDMSGGETARKQEILAGRAGKTGFQIHNDLTYYPLIQSFGIQVAGKDGQAPSDGGVSFGYTNDAIITVEPDGSFSAVAAGSTVLTVSSVTNPDVKMTIKVTVKDTLYPGIMREAWNDKAVSARNEWNFDSENGSVSEPSDANKAMHDEWSLVVMQSTTQRRDMAADITDGNIKAFNMGDPNRIYGIAMEGRVKADFGDINAAANLAWNKISLGSDATTLDIMIGANHDHDCSYRVSMVDGDGNVYIVQDWKTVSGEAKRENGIPIPAEAKGKIVALTIEQKLLKTDDNSELQIKGVWINQYTGVTEVSLSASSASTGQKSTFDLGSMVTVAPLHATNKAVTYTIAPPEGVENKLTEQNGIITVPQDAAVGEYTVQVTSSDNVLASAVFKLTVTSYTPVDSFAIDGITQGFTLHATFDPRDKNLMTDLPYQLVMRFNPGASDTRWTATLSDNSIISVSDKGIITFLKAGATSVTITPADNADLAVTFHVNVAEFSDEQRVAAGIDLTKTAVKNKVPAANTDWNTGEKFRQDWTIANVNKDHGNSKIWYNGNAADGEAHVTAANFTKPVNIIWAKMNVGAELNSFEFKIWSHGDNRNLESTNVRVQIIELGAGGATAAVAQNWTTISSRMGEKYTVSADLSAYREKDVVILVEHTGSSIDSGDYPFGGDSAAGAWLHTADFKLSTAAASAGFEAKGAISSSAKAALSAGWTANNEYVKSDFEGASVFALTYHGAANGATTLDTAGLFSNAKAPTFYVWGMFAAVNNDPSDTVTYAIAPNDAVLALTDNGDGTYTVSAKASGESELSVICHRFGSFTETVEFKVKVIVTIA